MCIAKESSDSKKKKFITLVALVLAICAVLSACLCACNKNPYASDNSFEIEITDTDEALTFVPKKFNYSYGVILYVGALVEPAYYTYLGSALAKQGYLTVIPKFTANMSSTHYKDNEPAFTAYPNVKFFIAGHDQGGGAAIRRAQANPDRIAGVLLYSPIIVPRLILGDDGKYLVDENGKLIYVTDSVSELSLPTLWIESDDVTRTDSIRNNIKAHLNLSTVTDYIIPDSTSSGFASFITNETLQVKNDSLTMQDDTDSTPQLDLTVSYTLQFLKSVVC